MMHGTHNVTLTHCNIMHGTHNVRLFIILDADNISNTLMSQPSFHIASFDVYVI